VLVVLLNLHKLFDTPGVRASRELRRQEHVHGFSDVNVADEIRRKAHEIAVVMLPDDASGEAVMDNGGTDAANFVCGHAHSHAVTANQDAGPEFAATHRQRYRESNVGIVHQRGPVIPKIFDFVPDRRQEELKETTDRIPSSIATQRYFHARTHFLD